MKKWHPTLTKGYTVLRSHMAINVLFTLEKLDKCGSPIKRTKGLRYTNS